MVSLLTQNSWLPWILIVMTLCRCQGQDLEANTQNAKYFCTRDPMDLVILVDSSQSVTGANFHQIITFLANILSDADIDSGSVRVALITFGKSVILRFNFESNIYSTKEEIVEAILETNYDMGESFLSDALETALDEVFPNSRPEVKKVMLVVTDGASDITSGAFIAPIIQLDLDRVQTFIIAVGLADQQQLALIEDSTKFLNVVNVSNFNNLYPAFFPFLTCPSRALHSGGGGGVVVGGDGGGGGTY